MKNIKKNSKAAIVCCSNGQPRGNAQQTERLAETLRAAGLVPVFSDFIFQQENVFCGTGRQRAEALMNFYRDEEICVIFDISGGDLANEVLPFLDFDVIAKSGKQFWGYSDLTVILNAIYGKTGQTSVLYQVRNLIYDHGETQIQNFCSTVLDGKDDLFRFSYHFLQGDVLEGIVVGGNIRCLLKLAGTPYWPDMCGKVLLLEAFGGTVAQMVTYLNQLQQIGVFEQISGLLLGTFTRMEEMGCEPAMEMLAKQYAGEKLPIVKTGEIGHGTDAKGIVIGEEIFLSKEGNDNGNAGQNLKRQG